MDDDSIVFFDGKVGSPPIVLSRSLFERIERLAAQANMEAVDLVQLALADVFNDPNMSLEALGEILRRTPDKS